jgi:predicted protein tyrosine phosphatase
MVDLVRGATSRRLAMLWPWAALAALLAAAVWHVVDFDEEVDLEYPRVVRPTFGARPAAAYRLAEPGDTIDKIGLYLAAGCVVLSAWGMIAGRRRGLWPAALGLSLAAAWYAATPGPTLDGWHSLGWRALLDPAAPPRLRLALAAAGLGLAALVVGTILATRGRWAELWGHARERGLVGLLASATALVLLRQVEIPGVEPAGYWPRWAFTAGMLAFGLGLLKVRPHLPARRRGWAAAVAIAAAWWAIVLGGEASMWYHRPLARLRAVVPGRIYISAMPTYRGLQVAHARHHFKTIINLFPEDTDLRSPLLPQEERFVREHGVRFVRSPSNLLESEAFIDRTLALARDPDAWPILVHCHGCVDRTPAWMGIYRFLVQGRPLREIMQEIERHRGYRPKASVTLVFVRVLPRRDPRRFWSDPAAPLLVRCASGTIDPGEAQAMARRLGANPEGGLRVSRREAPTRRP